MNAAHRQIAAHAAAGLSLCVGGYLLLVSPAATELASARAEAAGLDAQARQAEALRDRVPEMTREAAWETAKQRAIEERGRLARNERDLFAAISSLAQASHVRIDQLAPSKMPPAGKAAAPARPGDVAVRYSMTAVASYGDLAAFLRSVRRELGFSAVRSVRVAPLPDDNASAVRATIETEHFAFDTSALAGAGPGETR